LKPNDEKYQEAQKLVSTTGCAKQNEVLTECLKRNQKDWRQCKVILLKIQNETMDLNNCLKSRQGSGTFDK
jgi:hypothetical protein